MAAPKRARREIGGTHADIELVPDAWPRFERFIRQIVKAGPQHRPANPSKPRAKGAKSPKPKKKAPPSRPSGD
jgi:hypothetical protein